MKQKTTIVILLLITLIFFLITPACNKSTNQKAKEQEYNTTFPLETKFLIGKTSHLLPENIDFVTFFASYGSLTQHFNNIKKWGLFNPNELDALFNDLEIHNGLNPSSLASYHKAGFDTSGGFLLASYQNSPFAIFQINDENKFNAFWDNFVSEEFGRPRSHESNFDQYKVLQTNVLKKDLATIVYMNNLILIVAGPEMTSNEKTPPSLQAAKDLLTNATKSSLSKSPAFIEFTKNLASHPITAFSQNFSLDNQKWIPPKYASMIKNNASALSIAADFMPKELKLKAFLTLSKNAPPIAKMLTPAHLDLDKLKNHLSSKPSSAAKISFNTKELENNLPTILNEDEINKWNDTKDKLSIRLAGLNFQTQILDNLNGTLILQSHGVDPNTIRGASQLSDFTNAIAATGALDFTHPETADAYFNKINLVKKMIPQAYATIDETNNILHADIKKPSPAHIAYKSGIIAFSTPPAWTKLQENLTQPTQSYDSKFEPLLHSENLIAIVIDMQDLIHLLSIQYEAISVQIANFLQPFDKLTLTVSATDNTFNMAFSATLKEQ